ncbi:TPA: heavy metal translocating P-type ATPase [Streptococcus pyogenes]|uniref:heavy metal translocating P-type ATPase n=1 Tax=Streptococcus pyogenes TaxID=1314 RepID=UPI000D6E74D8|nr:heavy metal translocating P-type ATPase [Streptococcus pyogenes]HER4599170.1 cadmium-translocating P-type ATPase [Streptococcus pyogenes NGAS606]HER4649444.1 cadmium-translocating P-type ATPase [Streptococcus pyogenes NGAS465]HER4659569.1 cadmium-translocating P-type ATPase [Streptococcus pyogenes NGAS440]HER4727231.1 cadmium-translocating P-type ATPase [Streptococcus pyogenes NGAS312]PWO35814.1 cadmium-translocating P-type ATPase [Streptococcus pyogenes]
MTIRQWMADHLHLMETLACLVLIIIGLAFLHSFPQVASAIFITAFLIGGYASAKTGILDLVKNKHLSVDILMILAAIGAGIIGYWLEGALLIFIFSLSNTLEEMAMEKSKDAISGLMSLTPDTARQYQEDGHILEVETRSLSVGDRLQVRKGEAVPIDGQLLSPFGQFDESMVTGEPITVDKAEGQDLIGGTINQGQTIDMLVTIENDDTLFAKIINLVESAQEKKSKTATFIESLEDGYVKFVLVLIPAFILFSHFVLSWTWLAAFYRGMILLTVASPCALIASSTPASLAAISRAARKGLIIKGGDIVDNMGDIKAVVMDKTGTLTQGKPSVVNAHYLEDELLVNRLVKGAEAASTHPISKAFLEYTEKLEPLTFDHLEEISGKGFQGFYQGQEWRIGKKSFILEMVPDLSAFEETIQVEESQGKTLIFVSRDNQLVAYYALLDDIKLESKRAIEALHAMGIKTVMLTGDQERTANYVAQKLGIDEVVANCMPQDKVAKLAELKTKYGFVAMVGDGINDAPALAQADVSYAIGSGTDIAMESADSVIMDDLTRIPFSIQLSRKMKTIIKQNIVFALSVITLLILANVFQVVNLPLGVVGHEGSTILVILNGLRLLSFK